VGGGPAGAACAATLAERGRDVVIVDQDEFPRDKPCGDGLPPSAVDHLRAIGLGDLVDAHIPVEGERLTYEYRHVRQRRYADFLPTPATARCVRRSELDLRLLELARSAGARFERGRVTGLVPGGGVAFDGVVLGTGEGGPWIRARHIVAADGATSRLRRECGFGKPRAVSAYAVRTYMTVEKPLEPLFEGYIPIIHEGSPIPGYGWVFPLDEHTANVGIGYYRGSSLPAVPRLSALLESFVEELRTRARRRYGDIQLEGKLLGSPVAIGFAVETCERGNVVFVGDSARTTDPYTGEGIGNALQSGRAVALALDARSREGASAPVPGGVVIARRFPRLVQDPSSIARVGSRLSDDAEDLTTTAPGSFPPAFRRALVTTDVEPELRGTPAWRLLDRAEPETAETLATLLPRWMDAFLTTFPFTSEMLERELQSRSGPTVAALALLAARSADGELPAAAADAALATQCLELSRPFLMNVTDEADGTLAKLNNAFSVLIVDFAVSRGWRMSASLGARSTREFGATGCRVAEGLLLEFEDLYGVERTPERCVTAARATLGEVYALGAWLGAETAAMDPAAQEALRLYGAELGTAFQIAYDTSDFFAGEPLTGKKPGLDVLSGIYSLPVAHALTASRRLRRALTRGARAADLPAIVEMVAETGALERAREACDERVDAARGALAGVSLPHADPLDELAELPLLQLAALDPAGPPAYA
jgi:geranylgeranyl reductase family protein